MKETVDVCFFCVILHRFHSACSVAQTFVFEVCACDGEEYCCEIVLASCKSIVIFLYFCVGHPVSDLIYLVHACHQRCVLSPRVTVEGFCGGLLSFSCARKPYDWGEISGVPTVKAFALNVCIVSTSALLQQM